MAKVAYFFLLGGFFGAALLCSYQSASLGELEHKIRCEYVKEWKEPTKSGYIVHVCGEGE